MSFINEHRERFGVEPICDTLQVAPSTYYAAVSRPPSVRQARDGELKVEISRVRQENFDVYGTEKVWKQLRRESIEVGRDRVGRLMAELKLEGAVRGKTWRTTIPSSVASRPADLVDRDFSATAPNRLWVADLTYVSTWPGVVYTAFVTALEGADLKVDLAAMPRIIFTTPTVAAAGLIDGQANAQGIRCACRVLPLSAVPRALVNRDIRGFVKIVAERSSGRILGATVVADGAGDVIQAAVYAIRFGLTTDQVAATWSPYLTFAEGFKLAAQTFKRDVSKLSCCAA